MQHCPMQREIIFCLEYQEYDNIIKYLGTPLEHSLEYNFT